MGQGRQAWAHCPFWGVGIGDTPVGTCWTCWARVLREATRQPRVYTRVRTGKQAEAGILERPRLRLMEYAARKGYRVVLQASRKVRVPSW